jgi:hypothetical protein
MRLYGSGGKALRILDLTTALKPLLGAAHRTHPVALRSDSAGGEKTSAPGAILIGNN